jgi:hypothetical protein
MSEDNGQDRDNNGEAAAPVGRAVTQFKKGQPRPANAGRRPGVPNKMSVAMRDAVVEAIDWAGFVQWDKKRNAFCKEGKEKGLVAFMKFLALYERDKIMPLVQRVLPMHVTAAVVHRAYSTEDEVRALCAERGIPFESLIDLSVGLEDAPPTIDGTAVDVEDPMD